MELGGLGERGMVGRGMEFGGVELGSVELRYQVADVQPRHILRGDVRAIAIPVATRPNGMSDGGPRAAIAFLALLELEPRVRNADTECGESFPPMHTCV